jgi:hypothetical protein
MDDDLSMEDGLEGEDRETTNTSTNDGPPAWAVQLLQALHGNQSLPQESFISKKPRFPDPDTFDGDRKLYPTFRHKARSKLFNDARYFDTEQSKTSYIFQRLTGQAARVLLPWIERNIDCTMKEMWDFMDSRFKDPYAEERAMDKLNAARQGKKSVREYQQEFEEQLLITGIELPDLQKKSLFTRGLNLELQKNMVGMTRDVSFEALVDNAILMSDNLYRISLVSKGHPSAPGMWRQPAPPSQPAVVEPDTMDWQPTLSHQGAAQKRAKWVSPKELQHRRESHLCFRCGASNHIISACPYQPARRPLATAVAKVNTVAEIPPQLEDDTPTVTNESENE